MRLLQESPHFDGETYDPAKDHERLTGQLGRVAWVQRDGVWRTLDEIQAAIQRVWPNTADTIPAISARLRDFRKAKFAELFAFPLVNSRRRYGSLWEYQVDGLQLS